MEELLPKLLELWDKIKDPGAYDWDAILETAIAWAPSAGLFLFGILLGRVFSRRKKAPAFPPIDPEADAAARSGQEAQLRAELADNLRSEFDKKEAQLGGELASALLINEQQNSELKSLGDRLTSLQDQLAEKQARVGELAESLEAAVSHPGNRAAVIRAQAPIVQLAETVQTEYLRIATSVARLERLGGSLREQEVHLGSCAGEVSQTRAQLDHKARSVPQVAGLTGQMDQVDDQLRILHQNLRGCIQRSESVMAYLLAEKEKLVAAVRPIADAEEALVALGRQEAETDPQALTAALDQAHAKLEEAKGLLSELNNNVDQEIAEATGRVEWVVKDSPAKFYAAVEQLDADETSEDLGVTMLATRARRRLGEVRGCLAAVQLALETGAIGTAGEGCGKDRLQAAVARAVTGLEAARNAPAPAGSPEPDPSLVELEKDLAARDEAIQGLKQQIAQQKATLEAWPSDQETARRELAQVQFALDSAKAELEQARARLTGQEEKSLRLENLLAEREATLEKLAAEAPGPERSGFIHNLLGIAGAAGAGATAAALARSARPDVPPAENLQEAKDALHSLKGAADSGSEVVAPPSPTPAAVETPFVLNSISPGDKVSATADELVVFRGDNPRIWNSDFNDGSGRIAIPLARVPQDIDYLRLRRLDNGDSIVLPISRDKLLAGGDTREPRGWCGKVERYFGGHHLGAYDDALPQEVVTKFGAGGWGFGHLENTGSEQAFGWAGQKIEKTFFEISVGRQPAAPGPNGDHPATDPSGEQPPASGATGSSIPPEGLIIFRGNDPSFWNQTVYRGASHRARAIEDLPEEIAWLRIRRIDTGESVVLPVSKPGLTADGHGRPLGFNGTNEIFYGARHLGAYDESCPQEIETRFTYGGWGFGHRPVTSSEKESQACGWAGQEIAPGTVLEFTVFDTRPALTPLDRLLTR